MITHFKIFESKDDLEIIAWNNSYYSWEYDNYTANAFIKLDKNTGELYLKIIKVHVKTGLGAGTYSSEPVFIKIGTLQKADLALVRTLLKKNGYEQRKFSTFWEDEEGNKMSLSDLIKMHKPEKVKKELKYIKPIDTFKEPVSKDIELVQYSDKAYALFGEGTKQIKDQLKELGCRYNRFLTDPNSGEKRAGWIFPITKLDKIKELI